MTERDIFFEALEMATPEARAAYLQGACGRDVTLRRKVDELLKEHFSNDSLLAGSALDGERPGIAEFPVEEAPAQMIGRYKLLEKIGEGGFGEVWMAEQREPVKRRVALKIIKLGMDSRQIVARFEAERQALAMMDHANIAKVFDADVTDNGRPYFVMELVRGIKITEYCDQHQVPTRERLDLFIKVCHAIQHAHQKGIIHRDIKPSNILATIVDGAPVPKIIDFGIAKATTGQPLTDKTLFTAFQQFIGTPAYMSPEQAVMSGVDIDTRTDIYSLGVVLYELLTGRTPFDAEALLRAGIDEIRRTIRDQEPPKPSTRLHTLSQGDLTTTAQARHVDGHKLIQTVKGDLDWIVMKCLEKERGRRYETVNGLAADIQRHLANEPVVARPPSKLYEFQKTVRRHKVGFAATGAVIMALAIGLGVSTWQFVEKNGAYQRTLAAEQEQTRQRQIAEARKNQSEQVAKFLKDMLERMDPMVAMGRDTTLLREILDRAAERLGKDLKDQPALEAELRHTIAEVYLALGQHEKGERNHRAALALRQRQFGREHLDVAASLDGLARAVLSPVMRIELDAVRETDRNRIEEAKTLAHEALGIRKRLLGNEQLAQYKRLFSDDRPEVTSLLASLGNVLWYDKKLDEAEDVYREVLSRQRKALGETHSQTRVSLLNLFRVLKDNKQDDKLEALVREEVARVAGENDAAADWFTGLGMALQQERNLLPADLCFRESLAIRRRLFGDEHASVALSLATLANTLRVRGQLKEAEKGHREALEIRRKVFGNEHPEVAMSLRDLALVARTSRKLDEAEQTMQEALAMQRKLVGNVCLDTAASLCYLGGILESQKKMPEAEAAYREALEVNRKILTADNTSITWHLVNLARALLKQGKYAEATSLCREDLALHRKAHGETHRAVEQALGNLVTCLEGEGKLTEAEALCRERLVIDRRLWGDEHPFVVDPLQVLARVLIAQKKFAEADAPARESLAIGQGKVPDWRTFYSRSLLGGSLLGQKKYAEAESFLLSGFEGMKLREQNIPAMRKVRVKEALERLVQLYEATGQPEKAAEWNRKLAEFNRPSKDQTSTTQGP